MKRFVSVWNMHKSKSAFTLVEVMVAVMIISVIIMTLLKLQGNTNHIYSRLDKSLNINQYSSFLISNKEYGFENKSIVLDDLLSEFELEDKLRRELKNIKLNITYNELESIDMQESKETNSQVTLEVGKSLLKTDDSITSIIRFKLQ